MKNVEMLVKTPRGDFQIHTVFESEKEARENGWGIWFNHERYSILSKNNRVGAVVEN